MRPAVYGYRQVGAGTEAAGAGAAGAGAGAAVTLTELVPRETPEQLSAFWGPAGDGGSI